ncbi:hypothetical protein BZG36_01551 [Bifiguratus adelaidae]|uniref:Mediator of RNA polymerase II transcription subunit 19 n=1 Tax=Bifiguratus adelaidae TaxID=1938954 RepID=A0A261Y3Y5_9FUNG|nr:hypothetical protein BZG36_01551 [Bifiguratus adelaidae]
MEDHEDSVKQNRHADFHYIAENGVTEAQHTNRTLTGDHDLITRYNLLPAYDRHVRPYPPPNRAQALQTTYYDYISDLPGQITDKYNKRSFMDLIRDERLSGKIEMIPIDVEMLKKAINLRTGPVPGFDSSILDAPSSPQRGLADSQSNANKANEGSVFVHIPRFSHNNADGTNGIDSGERKHKKKKKKRKHEHGVEGDGSEPKRKKKRKRDREHSHSHGNYIGGNESNTVLID